MTWFMMKDIYINSVFVGTKSVYACTIVKDNKIVDYKVGHLSVQKLNKCCMYVSDLITLENKRLYKDELVFHYKFKNVCSYVKQMRPEQNICFNETKDKDYFNNNNNLISCYIKEVFPHFSNINIKDLEKWR